MYNKKGKNTIWIYAVILFTCVFILLLLTGYSQVKFNRNLNEYRNKLISSEEEISISSHNLKTALEENEMLYKKIEELNNILEEKTIDYEELEEKLKNKEKENEKSQQVNNYELLLEAEEYYNSGEIIKTTITLLENVDKNKLNSNGLKKYNKLKEEIDKKAPWEFYKEGYNNYIEKEYKDAKFNLNYSLKIAEDEYFSDDCYYYIAYSEYRIGEFELAKKTLETLIKKYPSSNYVEEAQKLLNIMENE
jgi:TolA-binding protein